MDSTTGGHSGGRRKVTHGSLIGLLLSGATSAGLSPGKPETWRNSRMRRTYQTAAPWGCCTAGIPASAESSSASSSSSTEAAPSVPSRSAGRDPLLSRDPSFLPSGCLLNEVEPASILRAAVHARVHSQHAIHVGSRLPYRGGDPVQVLVTLSDVA